MQDRRPPLRIRVFPDNDMPHVMQIHAGLHDLESTGRIRVRWTRKLRSAPRSFTPHTVWMEVESEGCEPIGVCFDMGDRPEILSAGGLDTCCLYFKRSYSDGIVRKLPRALREKVLPYGLNYACVGDSQLVPTNTIATIRSAMRGYETAPRIGAMAARRVVHALFRPTSLVGSRLSPFPPARAFEVKPDVPASPTVLFQTRVWEPGGRDSIEQLNQQRVAVVRALRESLGDRFFGGLERTPFARDHYPDDLSPYPTQKREFLAMVRKHLVTVTTTGLHDSIGWKLPEYISASRCIVSEPPRFRLPEQLEPGLHFLPFFTPEQCVTACERLLTNPDEAAEMRAANWAYYLSNVRPSALIARCIGRAESLLGIRSAPSTLAQLG